MKKALFIFAVLLLTILGLFYYPQKSYAACSDPVLTLTGKTDGSNYVTYHLSLNGNCTSSSTFYLTSPNLPSGWSYLYSFTGSNCSTNTRCSISIAGGTKAINLKITRPKGETPKTYTIYARAALSTNSAISHTVSTTYIVCTSCLDKGYECGSFSTVCAGSTVTVRCGVNNTVNCKTNYSCSNHECIQLNCNAGPSYANCTLSSGVCGTGSQACTYTTRNGSTDCKRVSCTSRSCSINCPSGQSCSSGQCIIPTIPNCNSGSQPTGNCIANTGECGPGTQQNQFTTLSGGGTCTKAPAPSTSCNARCSGTDECKNNQCVAPPAPTWDCNNRSCTQLSDGSGSFSTKASCESFCNPAPLATCGTSRFADFAPGSVPTGGICMLNNIIQIGLNFLVIVAIVLAILFAIWGGIDWTLSEGDKKRVESARGKLTMAVIGLAVSLVAFVLAKFLFKLFNLDL